MSWSSARASSSPSSGSTAPRASDTPTTTTTARSSTGTEGERGGWSSPAPRPGGWAQAQVSRPQPTPQSEVSASSRDDVDATTSRMLHKLELTHDMADLTLAELDEQNAKIVDIQDELAKVHDDLDTSQRKLAGIKGVFGVAWGKKKHHRRHAKARGKYERALAEESLEREERRAGEASVAAAAEEHAHMKALSRALDDTQLHDELRRQKKADRKVAVGDDEPLRFQASGFIFEEREDGMGEAAQAERDLEQIEVHVSGLKSKAGAMGSRVDESSRRLENVQAETERAEERTKKSIRRGDKIIG